MRGLVASVLLGGIIGLAIGVQAAQAIAVLGSMAVVTIIIIMERGNSNG